MIYPRGSHRPVSCYDCQGRGIVQIGTQEMLCDSCNGTGIASSASLRVIALMFAGSLWAVGLIIYFAR